MSKEEKKEVKLDIVDKPKVPKKKSSKKRVSIKVPGGPTFVSTIVCYKKKSFFSNYRCCL